MGIGDSATIVGADMDEHQLEEIPTLHNLPFDTKDEILSMIDSPRDLLSFGLASKEWASLIFPNHIEYRELRVHSTRHDVWKHLAARADLAKNIRSLCLMAPLDVSKEIFPWTLAGAVSTNTTETRRDPLPEMLQAIRNFKSLRSFLWTASGGHGQAIKDIFESLRRCSALDELSLGQIVHQDYIKSDDSLWKLCNLTELVLRGEIWASLGSVEDSFISLLNNSPNLESLTMTYNPAQSKFVSCTLRNLRKFHLWAKRGAGNIPSADQIILDFLVAHPRIEDLRWFPFHQDLTLPPGILPNLNRIFTKHQLATSLLRDKTLLRKRKMEFISQISLGPNTLQLLGMLDGSRLEEIQLWRFDGLDAIKRLAVLFPSIRTLFIPNFGQPSGQETYTLDDCIDCLAQFPNLEAVLESALWPAMQFWKNEDPNAVITRLLTRCPKLKRLDHWDSLSNVDSDIIFERSSGGVTWKKVASHDIWT